VIGRFGYHLLRPVTTTLFMNDLLKTLASEQLKADLPEVRPGDTVRVSVRVVEGGRERLQNFEGTALRVRGGGLDKQITIRRIASGVGVERTFMMHSPRLEKIEVVRHGHVRRAALYFLRERVGKSATLREKRS
jgi:large subunit ribosomal protein L19